MPGDEGLLADEDVNVLLGQLRGGDPRSGARQKLVRHFVRWVWKGLIDPSPDIPDQLKNALDDRDIAAMIGLALTEAQRSYSPDSGKGFESHIKLQIDVLAIQAILLCAERAKASTSGPHTEDTTVEVYLSPGMSVEDDIAELLLSFSALHRHLGGAGLTISQFETLTVSGAKVPV